MRKTPSARLIPLVVDKLFYKIVLTEISHQVATELVAKLTEAQALRLQAAWLRANEKYIKAYRRQLVRRFNEMEKDVLGNMKSAKGYKEAAFDVDAWLFNRKKWRGILTADNKLYAAAPLESGGKATMDSLGVDIAFDQQDPLVLEWLAANSKNAGWSIADTQYEALRTVLMEGAADGLSIPKLGKLVEGAMDVARKRAELIARTEMLKASNRGGWLAMKQSGVVEGKQWQATFDKRTCPMCAEMDGATMPLDEPFFKQGDERTFEGTTDTPAPENGITFKFDYEEVTHPPLHPDCRCTLLAIVKGV